MRTLASLLMLVIMLHSVCMGRCLGQQSSEKPPCHPQEETPKPDSNLCSEGPALEAKTSPVVKCTLDFAGLPCLVPAPELTLTNARQDESAFQFEPVSPPLLRLPVLRI